jgi:hypothetical protein
MLWHDQLDDVLTLLDQEAADVSNRRALIYIAIDNIVAGAASWADDFLT